MDDFKLDHQYGADAVDINGRWFYVGEVCEYEAHGAPRVEVEIKAFGRVPGDPSVAYGSMYAVIVETKHSERIGLEQMVYLTFLSSYTPRHHPPGHEGPTPIEEQADCYGSF